MNWPVHGSNPQYLYKAMGLPLPQEYVDFSANINPLGPPSVLKENWPHFYDKLMVYPDPNSLKLKTFISEKEKLPAESLLIGNGGSELIHLVSRWLTGKTVLIVQPTFSEYESACRANQCEIRYFSLTGPEFKWEMNKFRESLAGVDALFFCNPNNPTGIHYSQELVLEIIKVCNEEQCVVILDEAFYDFVVEYESMLPYIHHYPNLMILRSMTKMFSIPGLRLGYLTASAKVVRELLPLQPHWSVNTIALLAGEICLGDHDFILNTQEFIAMERNRLFDFFQHHRFLVTNSTVNFYLFKDPTVKNQYEMFEFLVKNAIIPRHTFNFPGLEGNWLRFAIKSREENTKLMEVLARWRTSHPLYSSAVE
ncbi:threonine-phosphate decarboxylase CobD [Neobacillus sp. LXY-1]|uniref:threonine-phosphate decarboxylase CobD n=1 Tax=Neobacillus sp. LXY-1 TaxID=3379133 RepID=UPI003EDEA1B8